MQDPTPRNLLIECRSCGIENQIANYVPSMHIFCSQCRERLMAMDINETHHEYVCQGCGMSLILLNDTKFKYGESACSCGSTDLTELESTHIADEAAEAGGLIGREMEKDELLEDTDWLRSDPAEQDDEDYNDVFDQDLGRN